MVRLKECPNCGKEFDPKVNETGEKLYGKQERMTCSKKCAQSMNGKKNDNKSRNFGTAVCPTCEKEFIKHAGHQVDCSDRCKWRRRYAQNIDYNRARDKKKVTRQKIGLAIRDTHLETPTSDAKWLWDGIGRWSVKYWPDITECVECNTSVYRHGAYGICERCYDKLRAKDEAKVKEWKRKSYEKKRASGSPFSRNVSEEWIAKAKERRIAVTPTIENLLDNLERL